MRRSLAGSAALGALKVVDLAVTGHGSGWIGEKDHSRTQAVVGVTY